jgi:hypothetical protein
MGRVQAPSWVLGKLKDATTFFNLYTAGGQRPERLPGAPQVVVARTEESVLTVLRRQQKPSSTKAGQFIPCKAELSSGKICSPLNTAFKPHDP